MRGSNTVKLSNIKINIILSIIYIFDNLVKHTCYFVKPISNFYSVRQFDNLTAISHTLLETLPEGHRQGLSQYFENSTGCNGQVVHHFPLIGERIDRIFDVIGNTQKYQVIANK